MRCRKNAGRVLAGILTVGMMLSSMPSAVYATENENGAAVAAEQEEPVLEENGEEAGQESADAEPVEKEEAEAGIENAGQPEKGKESEEPGKEDDRSGEEAADTADTTPEEENKGEQEELATDSEPAGDDDEIGNAGKIETVEEADARVVSAELMEADETEMSGSCGRNLIWRFADGVLTISGTGAMYDYCPPTDVKGESAPWYKYHLSNNINIERVVVEEGVTTIGAYAFYVCNKLTSIELPSSVTTIGENAFRECGGLTSIELPSDITIIEEAAFYNCCSLTSIEVPSGVTTIEAETFCWCQSLTSIELPPGVTTIGENAFCECTSLISIELPSGVTTIEPGIFSACHSLTGIELPSGVTTIGKSAFSHCRNLTSIELPSGVTTIGEYAFFNCDSLASIGLPSGVTTIGDSAFDYCRRLTDVYYGGSESDWLYIAIDDDNEPLTSATIHYNSSSSDSAARKMNIPFQTWYSGEKSIRVEWGWDKIIKDSTGIYDSDLAKISLALSSATENSQEAVESLLKKLGFGSPETMGGSPRPTFAHKLITRKDGSKVHVVAVVLRGTSGVGDVTFDILSSLRIMNWNTNSRKDDLREFIKEYNEKSDETITTDNVKFWITGHSLGAATANILAEDLSKEFGRDNVVAYTFAAPGPCSFLTPTNDENNINNILCAEDRVPSHLSTKIGWNGYGRKGEFHVDVKNTRDSINDQYHKLTGDYISKIWDDNWLEVGFLGLHATEVYMSFLETGYDPYKYSGGYFLVAGHCPVDLKVYDSDGAIVGSTTNNEIDKEYEIPGVHVIVDPEDDNAKYVRIFGKGDYIVEWTGTDDGTMEYSVKTVDANTDEIISEKTFGNVSLYKGKKLTSEINTANNSDVRLHVVGDDGNIVKEVQEDGTEIPFSGYNVKLDANGGSVNPAVVVCNLDGKIQELPIPYLAGYIFTGWYTDKACTVLWNSDIDRVKEDMTLYAGWKGNGNSGQAGDVLPEDIPADGKIPEGLWIAGVKESYTYTGTAIKPEIRVYDGKKRLQTGQDYTASYKNNTKVNDAAKISTAPTITVKGKGNYAGSETATFQITAVDLSDSAVLAEDITVASNKKVQKKVPVVTYNGKKLSANRDFTVSYPNGEDGAYKEAGVYDILLTAKSGGNFSGTRTVKCTITDNTLLSKVTVRKIPAQAYTGEAIEPELTVTFKGVPMVRDTDYAVTYTDNTEIGTAKAILTGIGKYAGTKSVSFSITGTSLKGASVSGIENKFYNGCDQKQNFTVTLKGRTLTEGTDYDVSYEKNKNVGKAGVTIKGKGAYTGTIRKTFTIGKFNIAANTDGRFEVTLKQDVVPYAKGGAKPVVTICFKTDNEKWETLAEGQDYTLSYRNLTAVNDGSNQNKQPVVTVNGKGSFSGTYGTTLTYKIVAQDLEKLKLTAQDKTYQNKKNVFATRITITDLDGKVLKPGTDYNKVLSYSYANETTVNTSGNGTIIRAAGDFVDKNDMIPAGTILKVQADAKSGGNYAGSLTGEYRMTQAAISSASVFVPKQIYTGRAITLEKNQITVRIKGKQLDESQYEIVPDSYRNNVKKGTAAVTIRGLDNYGGSKDVKFTIKAKGFLWWWR